MGCGLFTIAASMGCGLNTVAGFSRLRRLRRESTATQMGQRQPTSLRKGRPKLQDGVFLNPRGAGPATTPRKQVRIIVRMLLIMGGIKRNPGPQWPCTICAKEALHFCIQCVVCERWTHFTCAKLDGNRLPYTWSCRSCTEKENCDTNLWIMQFNFNGIRNNIEECVLFMEKVGCKIGLSRRPFLSLTAI